jgi:protein-tyrosine phosphatase
MRKIEPYSLWLGPVVDAWDLPAIHQFGIEAVVDLASNEAPIKLTRDLTYCRFPVVDGGGNNLSKLRLAIDTVEFLLCAGVSTFLFCSAGMSRSPAVAAAAIARVSGQPLIDALTQIAVGHAHDVSAGLICDIQTVLAKDSH